MAIVGFIQHNTSEPPSSERRQQLQAASLGDKGGSLGLCPEGYRGSWGKWGSGDFWGEGGWPSIWDDSGLWDYPWVERGIEQGLRVMENRGQCDGYRHKKIPLLDRIYGAGLFLRLYLAAFLICASHQRLFLTAPSLRNITSLFALALAYLRSVSCWIHIGFSHKLSSVAPRGEPR